MQKQHFVFLDGMRGVAALAVAILHAMLLFDIRTFDSHAYLAVDFFFCLSGFVVAYAYDQRLAAGMTVRSFAWRRLVRLHPMIVAGVVLGVIAALITLHPFTAHAGLRILVSAALGLFVLPYGLATGQIPFPINPPMWSLFYEYVANAGLGLDKGGRFNRNLYLALLAVLAVMLVGITILIGGVDGVPSVGVKRFVLGFVRLAYPFLCGMLVYRVGLFNRGPRLPAWLLALILAAILFLPVGPHFWPYDAVAAVVALPGLLILGARAKVGTAEEKIWAYSGRLSYPLYIVHYPVMILAAYWGAGRPDQPLWIVGSVVASLVIAHLLMVLYDEPLRRWLAGLKASPGAPAKG